MQRHDTRELAASLPGSRLALLFCLALCGVWSGCEQSDGEQNDDQDAGQSHVASPNVCDGIVNWDDGSDERDCPNLFQCERVCSGRCGVDGAEVHGVPFEKRCDHHADCPLADDEKDCPGSEVLFCRRDDYNFMRVYEPSQVCDGRQDCYWAEDEKDCPGFHECPWSGPGVESVPPEKVCDGKWDCLNDEFDCPDLVDPYTCPNGDRIARAFVCDGIEDCSHGEDESEPGCDKFRCEHMPFHPDRFHGYPDDPWYIDPSKVCDGVRDCHQGDDEQNCPSRP